MILDSNKTKKLALIALTSLSLSSQEINKDFINSLPDNLKNDVLNQITNNISNQNIDKKRYSSFSTQIKSNGNELVEPFELLDDFSNLRNFGQDFFQSFPSTFMPINDPSANSNYILDVGDTIAIQVVKGELKSKDAIIRRDGSIYLEDIGPISLVGISLSGANELINSKINQYFIDSKVIVSLKELRDIQVLVTGEVKFPGVYTLGGYSTVLHAIGASGGISESGSFRSIQVKRNGEIISKIDLYDLFVFADTSSMSTLRSGDSILIPSSNNHIRVVGAINRPAIYEFVDGETAEDIINIAGGYSNKSKDGQFLISREKKDNTSLIISSKNTSKVKLLKKDKIFLPYKLHHSDNLQLEGSRKFIAEPVNISGAVNFPGNYYLETGETLSALISKAGGYSENAYPFGGLLLNENALTLEVEYNERLYKEAIKSLASIATSFDTNINIGNVLPLISEFKNIKPTGRIRTEFDINKIQKNPDMDIILSQGDKIFIPFKQNYVHVFGEVLNPGSNVYSADSSVKDYIEQAGGLNKSADKSSIIIVHANGEAQRVRVNINVFGKSNYNIYPGSVIYVTRDLKQGNSLKVLSTISPIVSSLAISLASLNSINNN